MNSEIIKKLLDNSHGDNAILEDEFNAFVRDSINRVANQILAISLREYHLSKNAMMRNSTVHGAIQGMIAACAAFSKFVMDDPNDLELAIEDLKSMISDRMLDLDTNLTLEQFKGNAAIGSQIIRNNFCKKGESNG